MGLSAKQKTWAVRISVGVVLAGLLAAVLALTLMPSSSSGGVDPTVEPSQSSSTTEQGERERRTKAFTAVANLFGDAERLEHYLGHLDRRKAVALSIDYEYDDSDIRVADLCETTVLQCVTSNDPCQVGVCVPSRPIGDAVSVLMHPGEFEKVELAEEHAAASLHVFDTITPSTLGACGVVACQRPTTETWYMESFLMPGVHFVDVSEHADAKSWIRTHPDKASQISANATAFARMFNDTGYEHIMRGRLLAEYHKRVRFVSGWRAAMTDDSRLAFYASCVEQNNRDSTDTVTIDNVSAHVVEAWRELPHLLTCAIPRSTVDFMSGSLHAPRDSMTFKERADTLSWYGPVTERSKRLVRRYQSRYELGFDEPILAATRYLLSLDDNDPLRFQKLASNAVVLMVPPSRGTWFCDLALKPMVHYVPICEDMSDVRDQVDWCRAHADECEQMRSQAHEFIATFLDNETEKMLRVRLLQRVLSNH